MKEPDWASCTEEPLWKHVAPYLASRDIQTLLVGGSVVAIMIDHAFKPHNKEC